MFVFSLFTFFTFFQKKLLALLMLELSFLVLIFLFFIFSYVTNFPIFSMMIFLGFMVLDSVLGLCLLIHSSRLSDLCCISLWFL